MIEFLKTIIPAMGTVFQVLGIVFVLSFMVSPIKTIKMVIDICKKLAGRNRL
jgi:hypothetical protein